MTAFVLVVTGAGVVMAVIAWLARIGSGFQLVVSTVMLSALLLVIIGTFVTVLWAVTCAGLQLS